MAGDSNLGVKLEGMDEFIELINKYKDICGDEIRNVVFDCANDIRNNAQDRCPVKTARLKNSIGVEYAKDGLGAEVGTNVEYAPYVEYGTSRMASQPFMNPAARIVYPFFIEEMKKIFENVRP